MQNYPFLKCLSPVLLNVNGEIRSVKCGKCVACMNYRGSELTRLCELEMLGEYNTCYFITLTYSNDTIPTFRLQNCGNSVYRIYDECLRSDTYSKNLINIANSTEEFISIDDNTLALLKSRNIYFNSDSGIRSSYLLYSDIQKFLKRLRKNYILHLGYEEKLRYFVVGEYGHKSLRAHWHILLFVKSRDEKFFNRENIHKIWTFGRVDVDLSKGGCANYCASYISSSLSLPSLYKIIKKSSFSRHSIKLGYSYLCKYYYSEIIDKISFSSDFNGELKISYISGGAPRSVDLSYLSKTSLFSTPYNFKSVRNCKFILQYFRAYSFYSYQFRDVVYSSLKALSKDVFDYLLSSHSLSDYDLFIKKYLDIDNFCLCDVELYEKTFSRFLRYMYFSRQFVQRCDADTNYSVDFFNFFDYLDKKSLYRSLNEQSVKSINFPYILFYDNFNSLETLSLLKSLDIYTSFFNDHVFINKSKVIRKKMNDVLNLLNQ